MVTACGCPKASHVHGTRAYYYAHKCRCDDCRRSCREYENARVRRNAYGRSDMVDAEPVREHIRSLMAQGMGWRRVIERAGLSQSTGTHLLYGKRGHPLARVRRRTAARILAVQLDLAVLDGTGTRRRVQALVAAGYPQRSIAAAIGMTPSNLGAMVGRHGPVFATTARRVAALYREWEPYPGPSSRARMLGAAKGWPPPLAWDEDTIDDPQASAADVVRTHRTSNRLEDVVEDTEWLLSAGATMLSAAARLEMTPNALERALYRAGRPDLIGRLKNQVA